MHRFRRWPFVLIMLAGGLVAAGCGGESASDTASSEPVSSTTSGATESRTTEPGPTADLPGSLGAAPSFERTTLSGNKARLSDWEGRVVILNFWATWCAPCREEIPRLIDLQREYSSDAVQVAGVSIDEEGASVVRPFAEKMGIDYPLIPDPDHTLAEEYGGHYAVPTTFVIGPEGQIRQRYMRVVDEDDLRPVIDTLLTAR